MSDKRIGFDDLVSMLRDEFPKVRLRVIVSVGDAEASVEGGAALEHLAGSILFQHAIRRRFLAGGPQAAENQDRIRRMKVGYPWPDAE